MTQGREDSESFLISNDPNMITGIGDAFLGDNLFQFKK